MSTLVRNQLLLPLLLYMFLVLPSRLYVFCSDVKVSCLYISFLCCKPFEALVSLNLPFLVPIMLIRVRLEKLKIFFRVSKGTQAAKMKELRASGHSSRCVSLTCRWCPVPGTE